MYSGRYYATCGMMHAYITDYHQKNKQKLTFPDAMNNLYQAGELPTTPPPFPSFYSGMDDESFQRFVYALPIWADVILPQAKTFARNPSISEVNVFPDNKDVFGFPNMPYMSSALHGHQYFEITYVCYGDCELWFEDQKESLSKGDLCVVSPQSRHSLPMAADCLVISVIVRRSTFGSLFGNLLSKQDLLSLFFRNSLFEEKRANYIHLKTHGDVMVYETLKELVYESNSSEANANTCAISLLNLFLARALRAASAAVTLHHYDGYGERDFDFALILQFIQQNYRTITLSTLAETFHFSESYLSKMIRKNLGQNFTDILRTLKMNHAMEYLMNTPLKISEIAERVGYDSVDHFSRTFRKVYGMPPLEYQKSHHASE